MFLELKNFLYVLLMFYFLSVVLICIFFNQWMKQKFLLTATTTTTPPPQPPLILDVRSLSSPCHHHVITLSWLFLPQLHWETLWVRHWWLWVDPVHTLRTLCGWCRHLQMSVHTSLDRGELWGWGQWVHVRSMWERRALHGWGRALHLPVSERIFR